MAWRAPMGALSETKLPGGRICEVFFAVEQIVYEA